MLSRQFIWSFGTDLAEALGTCMLQVPSRVCWLGLKGNANSCIWSVDIRDFQGSIKINWSVWRPWEHVHTYARDHSTSEVHCNEAEGQSTDLEWGAWWVSIFSSILQGRLKFPHTSCWIDLLLVTVSPMRTTAIETQDTRYTPDLW